MGRPNLKYVIKHLQEAGFRTGRAYPGVRMPTIQVPAVTVSIERDEGPSFCLAVTVFVPEAMGGTVCEDTACQVTAQLRELGFSCVQEHCQYDGKGDRFFIRILATWTEPQPPCPFSVFLDGQVLKHLINFTVVRKTELEPLSQCGQEGVLAPRPAEGPWILTLEEQFPPDVQESSSPNGLFTLLLRRGTLGEQYQDCRWTEIRRQDTDKGLHQIRTALCQKWRNIPYE